MKKEDLKTIGINLFSSLIWQLFLTTLTSFSLTKLLSNILLKLLSNSNINSNIVIICLFLLIETIIFLITKKLSVKRSADNSDNKNVEDTSNKVSEIPQSDETQADLSNVDFYFEDYTKHVTIYKNGNGIIMNTFNVAVNNPDNFKEFKRKLNVEDGKKDIAFPALSIMKATSKEKRFTDFGFWVYKPDNSIIGSTYEKYWSDSDPDELDHTSAHNNKELRWVFEINRSKIKDNRKHKISYAISVPGLYPIDKGMFISELANEPESNGKASTSIHVEHYINKISYILSFEDGIKLNKEPECFTVNGQKIPIYDFYVEEGVFYTKYIFTISKPSYGTSIIIKWEFKGGKNMDKEGGD